MSNCGTCKHWTRPEDRGDFVSATSSSYIGEWKGPEEGMNAIYDKMDEIKDTSDKLYGICTGIHEGAYPVSGPEPELPLALSVDASDYMAKVLTREAFGCVLWDKGE